MASGQNTNSIVANVGTANTTISVIPSNSCGNGTAQTITTTIPAYRWKYVSSSLGSSSWCPGESRSISIVIKNNGTATWTDASPDINIGVKWNTNGANWADYYYRQNAGNLAPGASATYTFSALQASNATAGGSTPNPPTYVSDLSAGTNNLIFDVVNEGNCWFANNNGSCGPGNVVYTSPAITILTGNTITLTSATGTNNQTVCSGAITPITYSTRSEEHTSELQSH